MVLQSFEGAGIHAAISQVYDVAKPGSRRMVWRHEGNVKPRAADIWTGQSGQGYHAEGQSPPIASTKLNGIAEMQGTRNSPALHDGRDLQTAVSNDFGWGNNIM
ncbi:hypothetical protein CHH67_00115 [Paenibacillus campinasensis]|uniref:Uncharacterized protein n=1 Tax=Paenibacillus campinasensis TaxID=66347 RepID=A0A268F595_9BACL|nr:hypothetical protein CHH67_00115 [Paenibacillus campinasensis]